MDKTVEICLEIADKIMGWAVIPDDKSSIPDGFTRAVYKVEKSEDGLSRSTVFIKVDGVDLAQRFSIFSPTRDPVALWYVVKKMLDNKWRLTLEEVEAEKIGTCIRASFNGISEADKDMSLAICKAALEATRGRQR